jgi:high-affinity iron transporter
MDLCKQFIFTFSFLICGVSLGDSNDDKLSVHLLSYLSQDYGEAVRDGQIISREEYEAQIEFVNEVQRICEKRNYPEPIKGEILDLKKNILNKSDVKLVSKLANGIKETIIRQFGVATSPSTPLNFKTAKKIYQETCSQCHGPKGHGDGPAGLGLEPRPTNFHDLERMQGISPHQAYNTISLGVNGTGMAAYAGISEADRWSLAFYISSLRYDKVQSNYNVRVSLKERATLSDLDLIGKFKVSKGDQLDFLASVRGDLTAENVSQTSIGRHIDIARDYLEQSNVLYRTNRISESNNLALSAYLEGIEPIEGYLKSEDGELVFEIERNMAGYRSLLKEGAAKKVQVEQKLQAIMVQLDQADEITSVNTKRFSGFLLSFGIVMREALEAGLVLILLFSVIKKLNLETFGKWVHSGWITAVIGGGILYLIAEEYFKISGFLIESIEAYIGLFAAGILLLVGLWFHRHSNVKKWKEELQNAVENSAVEGKKITLFIIAFAAVFREIFETMLFVQILSIDGYAKTEIGLGALAAVAFAVLVIYLAIKFSLRINLGILFKGSTALILFLSVVLFGKSISAFQKIGFLGSTDVGFPSMQPIGFNSTLEVLSGQLILLLLIVGYFYISRRLLPELPNDSEQRA